MNVSANTSLVGVIGCQADEAWMVIVTPIIGMSPLPNLPRTAGNDASLSKSRAVSCDLLLMPA